MPERPIDCMQGSRLFGASEGSNFSDWKNIDQLSKDHALIKIKVCTDSSNRNVLGLQLTYGGTSAAGDALEEVPLESHGIVDEGIASIVMCDVQELRDGEYISELEFGYTSEDLVTLTYRINSKRNRFAYGELSETTLQTRPVTFSPDSIMFYGFNGRT